jgi:hypothetical protein
MKKRLLLNRETVRALLPSELDGAHGALVDTRTCSCPGPVGSNNCPPTRDGASNCPIDPFHTLKCVTSILSTPYTSINLP